MADYIRPVGNIRLSQDHSQHVQRAKDNGWCWLPGQCPAGKKCTFYYGGNDYPVVEVPVLNSREGDVIKADWNVPADPDAGYGREIRVKHTDRSIAIYAHLSAIEVTVRQHMKQGERLGVTGHTGNCWPEGVAGSHLHFEVRDPRGVPIDPEPLFGTSTAGGGALVPDVYAPEALKAGQARLLISLPIRAAPSKNGQVYTRLEIGQVITVKPEGAVTVDGVVWYPCTYIRAGWIGYKEGDEAPYLEQVKP